MTNYTKVIEQLIKLRNFYDVIGGECTVSEQIQRIEEHYYKWYLSDILARRMNVPMMRICDDNEDELPLFMVNLGEGHVATCYKVQDIPEELSYYEEGT